MIEIEGKLKNVLIALYNFLKMYLGIIKLRYVLLTLNST